MKTNTDEAQDDLVTPKVGSPTPVNSGPATTPTLPQSSGITPTNGSKPSNQFSKSNGDVTHLEEPSSQLGVPRVSVDKTPDNLANSSEAKGTTDEQPNGSASQNENLQDGSNTASPTDGKDDKPGSSLFGKKFRMNFQKKLGRSSVEVKHSVIDEKSQGSEKSDQGEDKSNDQYFLGTIDDIRTDYETQLHAFPSHQVVPGINPSPLNDTPKLNHPPYTTVIIQEEQPDAGGVADLYRGTVSSVGHDADVIEKCAPRWLGELLLRV